MNVLVVIRPLRFLETRFTLYKADVGETLAAPNREGQVGQVVWIVEKFYLHGTPFT